MQLIIAVIASWVIFFYGFIAKTPDTAQLFVGMLTSFFTGAVTIAWLSQRTSAKSKVNADAQITNWQDENLKLLNEIEILEKENRTLRNAQLSDKSSKY